MSRGGTRRQRALLERFRRRKELLRDSLTTQQVAELFGTTRQAPHERVKRSSMVAAADGSTYRFPAWQFDPESSDGVVAGLPQVLRALRLSPLSKISWLTRPNAFLDGATPIAALKAGQIERVVELARGAERT